MTRALAGGSAVRAASCSSVPAATTWPPPLVLAAVSPCRSEGPWPPRRGRRRAPRSCRWGSPRSRRPCPGRARGRRPSRRRRSAPRRAAAAVISPTECPALAPTLAPRTPGGKSGPTAARPAPTISGWATAVSLIVSASDVVPWATRSRPATSESDSSRSRKIGSSSQGARKPGVWEPCPGQTITSTYQASLSLRDPTVTDHHQHLGPCWRVPTNRSPVAPDGRPGGAAWRACPGRGRSARCGRREGRRGRSR